MSRRNVVAIDRQHLAALLGAVECCVACDRPATRVLTVGGGSRRCACCDETECDEAARQVLYADVLRITDLAESPAAVFAVQHAYPHLLPHGEAVRCARVLLGEAEEAGGKPPPPPGLPDVWQKARVPNPNRTLAADDLPVGAMVVVETLQVKRYACPTCRNLWRATKPQVECPVCGAGCA